jgi:LAO/AO transport system kinase
MLVESKHAFDTPVIKTSATKEEGITELSAAISRLWSHKVHEKKLWLLTEKAYRLIVEARMKDITRNSLQLALLKEMSDPDFTIYRFVRAFLNK